MATFFSNTVVGLWGGLQTRPIYGTLSGTVTRIDATSVTLSDLSLVLSSSNVYPGSLSMNFTVGRVSNTLSITGGSTYLGTFSLANVGISVIPTANNVSVPWQATAPASGYGGYFGVTFPSYPSPPGVKLVSKTPYSITVEYGTGSFGNGATGGTVTLRSGSTTLDTSTQTGLKTFTYSGLEPDTLYTLSSSATNSYGNISFGQSINVTTLKDVAMYGSVNNFAKPIDKIYGSLNGQTKEIVKIYGSLNGVTERIF